MAKSRHEGYIKDYDGGTLMECYVHPGMDYLNVPHIVAQQRAFVYSRLLQRSQAGMTRSALELFSGGKRLRSALDAPGVGAAGWSMQHVTRGATVRDHENAQNKLHAELKMVVNKIYALKPHAAVFREAPAASALVQDPLSLEDVSERLAAGDYYRTREMLVDDLLLMVDNCRRTHAHAPGCAQLDAADHVQRLVAELLGKDKEAPAGAGERAD